LRKDRSHRRHSLFFAGFLFVPDLPSSEHCSDPRKPFSL
jgi:hypothetical protein